MALTLEQSLFIEEMKIYLCSFLTLLSIISLAQKQEDSSRTISRFSIISTFGSSSFIISLPATDFASLEARLGAGYTTYLSRKLDMIISTQLGVKFKRESYLNGQFYSQPGIPLFSVNETASNRNHWFVELPVLLQYNFRHPRLSIRGGMSLKSWFPNNDDVDMLTATQEVGGVCGIQYRTKRKINFGVEYYESITKILSGSMSYNNGNVFDYEIRNRSLYCNLTYLL